MNIRSIITIVVVLTWSHLFAELKPPVVDGAEKPGQRKLDVINETGSGQSLAQDQTPEEVSVSTLVIKTFLGLAFIILLIVVLIYLMKKLQGSAFNKFSGQGDLEVLDMTPLGQQHKIMTVKLHGKILVLGVTQQSINTLTTIEGDDAERYLNKASQSGIASGQFNQTVNQLLSKFKRTEVQNNKGGDSAS